jgi:hypothetical protein
VDEAARLATLRSKFVLDTAPDDTLDALVSMCAEMFDVPVALVSLVDERRQWFKARKNFDATQTGRAESFCAWTTLCIERKVLVVRDATADEKFKDNPIVTGDPGVRFYAGAPLVVDDVVLGALCLIDFEPHLDEKFFDEAAARRLRAVAQTVATHLARPSFGTWLGAAIDTVREGVLLLEHAAAGKEKDKGKEEREELTRGVFDSVDEYMATEMLRDAPTRVEIRDSADSSRAFPARRTRWCSRTRRPSGCCARTSTTLTLETRNGGKRAARRGRSRRRRRRRFPHVQEPLGGVVRPARPPGSGGPGPGPRVPGASRDRRDAGARLGAPGERRGAPSLPPRRRARRGVREHGGAHAGQGAKIPRAIARALLAVAEPRALRVHQVDSDGHGG